MPGPENPYRCCQGMYNYLKCIIFAFMEHLLINISLIKLWRNIVDGSLLRFFDVLWDA